MLQQCMCKKGKCESQRCSCRKDGRRCNRSKCRCHLDQCQNLGETDEQMDDEEDEESESVAPAGELASTSAESVSSSSSGVQFQCPEETFDPERHNEIYHNSRPFVLREYSRKIRKCHGCSSDIVCRRDPEPKFVISHEEQREYWAGRGRKKVSLGKAHYHCSASCIAPHHPYFKPSKVASTPSVARKLTKDDIRCLKLDGIDLSFLRK